MKPSPRQPRNNSTAEKAHDKPSEAAKQILPADEQRANKRASNKQLAVIWKLWNALPATLSADERRSVLTGAEQYQGELKALRKQFPKAGLPLDENTFNKALEAVHYWHSFMDSKEVTFRPEMRSRVEAEMRHEIFSAGPVGRVSIYRTVRELEELQPQLLRTTAPTLEQIRALKERHDAYTLARRDAVSLLSLLLAPELAEERAERERAEEAQVCREQSTLPDNAALRMKFARQAAHALRKGAVPAKAQALFWSKIFLELKEHEHRAFLEEFHKPPDRPFFRAHLYVARLLHFRVCPADLRERYMTTLFPNLSRQQMEEFICEYARPSAKRAPYTHLKLWAWLLENAPVFTVFEAQWPAIHALAMKCFNMGTGAEAKSPGELSAQWSEFTRAHGFSNPPRLKPRPGPPSKHAICRPVSEALLTPRPNFRPFEKP